VKTGASGRWPAIESMRNSSGKSIRHELGQYALYFKEVLRFLGDIGHRVVIQLLQGL